MAIKIFKLIFFIVTVATVFLGFIILNQSFFKKPNNFSISPPPVFNRAPNSGYGVFPKIATTTENIIRRAKPDLRPSFSDMPKKSETAKVTAVAEVSSKSFEELINGSVIQLYCGNLNGEKTDFSNIARGTGIIIDSDGEILTNRHIIYNEINKKLRSDCFVLKSSFPNFNLQKPKIYYIAQITNYPLTEKFNDAFSKDKYYNDFAVLKIISRPGMDSKINLLLELDYASSEDYFMLENNAGRYNYLPIDWNYQPKNDDALITLGYGIDASHNANQITSTSGKLSGNVNIDKNSNPEIILIESNATAGFSGGALINPQSKGLVGLIGWITSGDSAGKFTVAVFRDFLRNLMIQDLNFDLKLTTQNQ